MNENQLSEQIIGAAIEVHKEFGGPGLLESVYQTALEHELTQRGYDVQTEINQPIFYKGVKLEKQFRIDILVNSKVIVECKAVETLHPSAKSQLLTYLRLSQLKLGLIINFGASYINRGINRVANNL